LEVDMFLRPITLAHRFASRAAGHPSRRLADDRGQATAEYGLVILVAGGIALGVIAWAAQTGTFSDLFESVVDKLSENL
jgi:Flp pilus assembly pilin Flp